MALQDEFAGDPGDVAGAHIGELDVHGRHGVVHDPVVLGVRGEGGAQPMADVRGGEGINHSDVEVALGDLGNSGEHHAVTKI